MILITTLLWQWSGDTMNSLWLNQLYNFLNNKCTYNTYFIIYFIYYIYLYAFIIL